MTQTVVRVSDILMPDRASSRTLADVLDRAHVPDRVDSLGLDPGELALNVYALLTPYQDFSERSLPDIPESSPSAREVTIVALSYAAAKGLREVADARLDAGGARNRFEILAGHARYEGADAAARYAFENFDAVVRLVRAIDAQLDRAADGFVDAAKPFSPKKPEGALARYLVWHKNARYSRS